MFNLVIIIHLQILQTILINNAQRNKALIVQKINKKRVHKTQTKAMNRYKALRTFTSRK